MKKIIHLFILCFLLFSCQEDEAVSNVSNESNTEQTVSDSDFTLQNFGTNVITNFSGIIRDVDGNKLSEVQINIGNQTAMTDENGVFFLNDAVVYENFAYITANKNGYIKASRAVVPMQNGVNEITITLLVQNTIATITAGEASEVSLPNGAQVAFAGGFVNASGGTYNGVVSVSLHYLEPNQQETFTQMPGMLFGKRADGTATGMETYGMLSVNLYGANGEVLNIDSNTPATLTLPVSASTPNAPESMPMWYFDEAKGYWKEEGVAVKVGNVYVVQVTHFTWWNCDFPLDTVNACFNITATTVLSDFYFEIIRNETNQTVYSGYTNDTGEACGLFPKDEALTLTVYGNCSDEVIYTQVVGPYGEDVTTIYTISNLPT
ncbi:MAG: hypothetical protein HRT69_17895 [Flavobacteriaceae bacterium]|nr:hypothetical protein [Flavobacteriaceae bacterium]